MMKIFLTSSLILNSFLLIYLFGIIPFLLFISMMLNVAFAFYTRYLLSDRLTLRTDFDGLLQKIDKFTSHLSQIYELEMFYGDETLAQLLTHARNLIDDFYKYEDAHFEEVPDMEELSDVEEEIISEEKENE